MYVQEVAEEIVEDKALKILLEVQIQEYQKWFDQVASKHNVNEMTIPEIYNLIFKDIFERDLSDITIVEKSDIRIVYYYDLSSIILDAICIIESRYKKNLQSSSSKSWKCFITLF